jgi:hypothetical protein
VCLFKAILDSFRFYGLKTAFPNAGFIYIFRRPKEVIDSFAQEFSGQLHTVNHLLNNDFLNNHLFDITGVNYDLPRINQLLGEYQGRLSASGDHADKIALYWVVFHLFLIDDGGYRTRIVSSYLMTKHALIPLHFVRTFARGSD